MSDENGRWLNIVGLLLGFFRWLLKECFALVPAVKGLWDTGSTVHRPDGYEVHADEPQ